MNGGLYIASAPSHENNVTVHHSPTKPSPSVTLEVVSDQQTNNHGLHHHSPPINNHHQQHPLHIPAKRLGSGTPGSGGLWSTSSGTGSTGYGSLDPTSSPFLSPSSASTQNTVDQPTGSPNSSNNTSSNSYRDNNGTSSLNNNNNNNTSPSSSSASSMTTAAASYPPSHYSSIAAMEASARRPSAVAPVSSSSSLSADTKPAVSMAGLSFWGNDYPKYSAAGLQHPSAAGADAMCGAAAAAFQHQSPASWNYPHPSQYALTSPEQAAEVRARQMTADAAAASSFHADYSRLQYPHEGIYTHPPGENNRNSFSSDRSSESPARSG